MATAAGSRSGDTHPVLPIAAAPSWDFGGRPDLKEVGDTLGHWWTRHGRTAEHQGTVSAVVIVGYADRFTSELDVRGAQDYATAEFGELQERRNQQVAKFEALAANAANVEAFAAVIRAAVEYATSVQRGAERTLAGRDLGPAQQESAQRDKAAAEACLATAEQLTVAVEIIRRTFIAHMTDARSRLALACYRLDNRGSSPGSMPWSAAAAVKAFEKPPSSGTAPSASGDGEAHGRDSRAGEGDGVVAGSGSSSPRAPAVAAAAGDAESGASVAATADAGADGKVEEL